MGRSLDGRLNRLEQAQQQDRGDKIVYTDGANYGLDPVKGGWAVIVQDGNPVKAWQREIWDAWDEQGRVREEAERWLWTVAPLVC